MKKNYAITCKGKLVRKSNSLTFINHTSDNDSDTLIYDNDDYFNFTTKRDIPINDVDSINIFEDILMTKKLIEFVTKNGINMNVFGYYGNFVASLHSQFYKFSGSTIINQSMRIVDNNSRLLIGKKIISAGLNNIYRNIQYYSNRGRDFTPYNIKFNETQEAIENCEDVNKLMLIEAGFRKKYYKSFEVILLSDMKFVKRSTLPPKNEINALMSFLNALVYSIINNQLCKTFLHPGISFIHEPGDNRLSLVWDIAEIFKPVIADRILFGLINRKRINKSHFKYDNNSCLLNDNGRKIVLEKFNEKAIEPNSYYQNKNNMSLLSLIKEECYKIQNYVNNGDIYKPFIARW